MADQVSVAESIVRVSTSGFELAQQLYGASEDEIRSHSEELNALRSQLQNLDVLLATMSDLAQESIVETMLEATFKEGPCSSTASINEVSFSQDLSSSFPRRFSFETDSEDCVRNLDLETDRQSYSSSFTEGEFHDVDQDYENEGEFNLNKEDATHLVLGDIQVFSPTQTFVQSMLKSTELELRAPTSPETQYLEPETSPRIQITHASETGLNSHLSLSHSRRISGCSDSSTLQGSVHEDEEFPMRKDGNEDVIQIIEIPLKSPGRKRGSSLFGSIKKVVARN